MATVTKDFKVKAGLVVEGANATVGGYDVLKKDNATDEAYIINLIGGSATSDATPETVVLRDENADFSANMITSDLTGEVTGTVSDISNHSTSDLSEGSNQYFTAQRALDATASAYDAAGSAATAEANAIAHADGLAVNYDAAGSAAAAEAAANLYTDGRETAITTAYQSYADQAEADAISAAAADATTKANAAQAAAELHADTAIANLVDSAPATLDTLNELAAALQDNPDIISDLQDIAAGKQDTLTAGTNIDITGATISVTGLDTDDVAEGTNLYFTDARAVTANTGLWDTIGAAAAAQTAAEATASADATNKANAAEANAIAHADALTTDDIEEGVNNEYFTDERAQDAVALAIAAGSHDNIEITYANGALSFSAENGIADSTTSDLVEGTNLYFTDARAVSALEAVVPNFTEIDINDVATQVAASSTGDASQNVVAYQFATADYRSAKFLVKVAYGTHTEVSEVLLTLDTSDNIAITEFAVVGTNGSASAVSADVSGGNVRLLVTPTNNSSTIKVMGTLLV